MKRKRLDFHEKMTWFSTGLEERVVKIRLGLPVDAEVITFSVKLAKEDGKDGYISCCSANYWVIMSVYVDEDFEINFNHHKKDDCNEYSDNEYDEYID